MDEGEANNTIGHVGLPRAFVPPVHFSFTLPVKSNYAIAQATSIARVPRNASSRVSAATQRNGGGIVHRSTILLSCTQLALRVPKYETLDFVGSLRVVYLSSEDAKLPIRSIQRPAPSNLIL
jgi:hypothetical protein